MKKGISTIMVIAITFVATAAIAASGWYYFDKQNKFAKDDMQAQIDNLQKQINSSATAETDEATAASSDNAATPPTNSASTSSTVSSDIFSLEKLKNASYAISDFPNLNIQLKDGYFDSKTGTTFTLDTTTIGYHKNASGVNDAAGVILKMSSGGTGVEKYLVLMNQKGSAAIVGGDIDLGDRVQVKSISLSDQLTLTVNYLGFAASDPSCCPSVDTTQTYKFVSGPKLQLQ